MIAKRIGGAFRAGGVRGVLRAALRRIRTPQARSFGKCKELVMGGRGLEIGGPSSIFASGGLIPVYPIARQVDIVNFARATIWDTADGDKSFGLASRVKPGERLVAEGADLRSILTGQYDFVLSSHMLEHTANPLRALAEWRRILKLGGTLVLVVPARDGTFDHRRPVTTMSHLLEDFQLGRSEDDLTHVAEVLLLHDLSMDPGVADADAFRERALRNADLRSIHHHVFDTRLVVDALLHAGFDVSAVEPLEPYHIIALARSPFDAGVSGCCDEGALRDVLRKSPFASDRAAS